MKGIMIFANGFEDVEAIATVDILKRAQIEIDLISFEKEKKIISSSNINILFDKSLTEINYKDYDFLILPGGKAVFNYLRGSYEIAKMITYFCDNKKLVCAICAAPLLLGRLGYLRDKNYTVFPGCGDEIVHGNYLEDPVVVSDNIITARSMYYSCDFALEIVNYLLGSDIKEKIRKQVQGLL